MARQVQTKVLSRSSLKTDSVGDLRDKATTNILISQCFFVIVYSSIKDMLSSFVRVAGANLTVSLNLQNALCFILSVFVTQFAFRALKNAFFHPLSKVPGPWLYATGRIPYAVTAMRGRLAVTLHQLHERYGPVVRVASDEISYINAEAWDVIYGKNNSSHHEFPKAYDLWHETDNTFTKTVFLANDDDHSRIRSVLSPAFADRMLCTRYPSLQSHINEFLRGIEKASQAQPEDVSTAFQRPVDLNDWFHWLAFDMTSELVLGESFSCLKVPEHRGWLVQLSKTWHFISVVSALKSLGGIKRALSLVLPRKRLQKHVDQLTLISKAAAARLHGTSTEPTMVSIAQSSRNEQGRTHTKKLHISDEEIMANVPLFVTAGTDTTATLLPALIYLLSTNRDAWHKVVSEIRSFPSEENLMTNCMKSLPYLSTCIQETLRFYPPVPEGLPRVCPDPGQEICGYWIPGGVYCQVSIHAANQSSTNFVDADRFLPERWNHLERQNGSRFAGDKRAACRPFSTGPRDCIGQNFALLAIKTTISRLLYQFDVEPVTTDNWCDQRSYLLWQRKPLMVNLKPRN